MGRNRKPFVVNSVPAKPQPKRDSRPVRPRRDKRWPAFCVAVAKLKFNPKLLESDQEWVNHFGQQLWQMFLEGYSAGERGGSRLKRLSAIRRFHVTLRAKRREAGRCIDCETDAVPGRSRCKRHLEAAILSARRYYRRRFWGEGA